MCSSLCAVNIIPRFELNDKDLVSVNHREKIALITDIAVILILSLTSIYLFLSTPGGVNCLGTLGTRTAYALLAIMGGLMLFDIAKLIAYTIQYRHLYSSKLKAGGDGKEVAHILESRAQSDNITPLPNVMCQLLYWAVDEGKKNHRALNRQEWPTELPKNAMAKAVKARGREKVETQGEDCWGSILIPNLYHDSYGYPTTWKTVEDHLLVHHFTLTDGNWGRIFGVFDGHCDRGYWSKAVSKYLKLHIPSRLGACLEVQPASVRNLLIKLCQDCEQDHTFDGGTTLCCALEIDEKIYIFNIGDSRAVLIKTQNQVYYQLSEDADPQNPRFKAELEKNGHEIINGRVKGYNLARDIGVHFLSSEADVVCIQRGKQSYIPVTESEANEICIGYAESDYLILATDGFWDVCRNSELTQTITKLHYENCSPKQIAEYLGLCARSAESLDDISVLVVKL